MLWALASSAFVIYLYRKLNAEEANGMATPEDKAQAGPDRSDLPQALTMEIARLNERINSLDSRLSTD
jgi:hypothetical protein